jgi:hypothetical protein
MRGYTSFEDWGGHQAPVRSRGDFLRYASYSHSGQGTSDGGAESPPREGRVGVRDFPGRDPTLRKPTVATAIAVVIALAPGGCATVPPPAPSPTLEEFQALSIANESMARERDALEEKVAVLETKLKSLESQKEGAKYEAARLGTEIKRLESEVASLEARLEDLNTKSMYNSSFPRRHQNDEPARVLGTVLASDSMSDIHWISIDPKDGIKVADELTVFRKDAFVAVVVVEEIVDKKARVVVKKLAGKPMQKSAIQVGDKYSGVF